MAVAHDKYESGDEDFPDDDFDDLFGEPIERYVHVLTREEARKVFDQRARRELGISGEEFLQRWDSGELFPIPDDTEGRKIARLGMIISFAR